MSSSRRKRAKERAAGNQSTGSTKDRPAEPDFKTSGTVPETKTSTDQSAASDASERIAPPASDSKAGQQSEGQNSPWLKVYSFVVTYPVFSTTVGLFTTLIGTGYSLGLVLSTLYFDHQILDSKVGKAVDEKVGKSLTDFDERVKRVERENEVSRKAMECYSEMQAAICKHDYNSALLAFESLVRKYSAHEIPEPIRNTIYEATLLCWLEEGRFERIKQAEVDEVASSLDRAERKPCASAYINLGFCYLCLRQAAQAKRAFLHALDMEQNSSGEDESSIVKPIAGMILTCLAAGAQTAEKDRIASAMEVLDECELRAPIAYKRVHSYLADEAQRLVTYLRVSDEASFSKTYFTFLEDLSKNLDRMKEVEENGNLYVRGTVTRNGKPIQINKFLRSKPKEMERPTAPPPKGEKRGC